MGRIIAVDQEAGLDDTRVIEQAVDLTERFHAGLNSLRDLCSVRRVCCYRNGLSASCFDFISRFLCALFVQVHTDDLRAVACADEGGALSHPGCRSGDHGYFFL